MIVATLPACPICEGALRNAFDGVWWLECDSCGDKVGPGMTKREVIVLAKLKAEQMVRVKAAREIT